MNIIRNIHNIPHELLFEVMQYLDLGDFISLAEPDCRQPCSTNDHFQSILPHSSQSNIKYGGMSLIVSTSTNLQHQWPLHLLCSACFGSDPQPARAMRCSSTPVIMCRLWLDKTHPVRWPRKKAFRVVADADEDGSARVSQVGLTNYSHRIVSDVDNHTRKRKSKIFRKFDLFWRPTKSFLKCLRSSRTPLSTHLLPTLFNGFSRFSSESRPAGI